MRCEVERLWLVERLRLEAERLLEVERVPVEFERLRLLLLRRVLLVLLWVAIEAFPPPRSGCGWSPEAPGCSLLAVLRRLLLRNLWSV